MRDAMITEDAIDTQGLLAGIGSADGAAVLFVGVVRDHNEGRPVEGVTYEAYREMAERELAGIVADVRARTGVQRIRAVHRTGTLAVGETSVAVVASASHRAEAFDAARAVIEAIKERLPVWKREHYADGPDRWLEGTVPPAAGRTS